MISKLGGIIIDSCSEDSVILDVGGVGYLVHCSGALRYQELPGTGQPATLAIETILRAEIESPVIPGSLLMRSEIVPPAADRARRRRQGRARGARHAQAGRTRHRDRDARQGDGGAHARRRAEGRRAHRHPGELKDRAPAYADLDPKRWFVAGSVGDRRAAARWRTQSSALVNLGAVRIISTGIAERRWFAPRRVPRAVLVDPRRDCGKPVLAVEPAIAPPVMTTPRRLVTPETRADDADV